jgi:alcohol dehydrogenase (cytochrome c)
MEAVGLEAYGASRHDRARATQGGLDVRPGGRGSQDEPDEDTGRCAWKPARHASDPSRPILGSGPLTSRRRRVVVVASAVAALAALGIVLGVLLSGGGRSGDPPELARYARDWPAPNGNLGGTRAAAGATIDSTNVDRLRPVWRFRFRALPGLSGIVTSTPIVLGDRVFVQDLDSNVYALDAATGRLVWQARFRRRDDGPNGLAAGYGRIYGNTDRSAFALDARTGKLVWARRIARAPTTSVDIAPVVANGLVYTSSVGLPPGGRGVLYALDAATGRVRWSFDTIRGNWAVPKEAAGGGGWWPLTVGKDGRVYAGNSNPYPWGGTARHPNGGAYRGRALYTDSLLALDGRTGELLWSDQVVAHDVRDYDLAVSPILARLRVLGDERDVVFGASKGGRVYAWDVRSGRRLWQTPVGRHLHDRGPLPSHPVTVCPGLLGGVETPMAYDEGRLFVPLVDLCMRGSATGFEDLLRVDVARRGRGGIVALDASSGRRLWSRRFPAPAFGCATVSNDVVFVPTFDGRVYALAASTGHVLWQQREESGINACPAVSGNLLLVGAGIDYPDRLNAVYQLTAYRLATR